MVASVLHLLVSAILAGLTVVAVRTWVRQRRSYTPIVAVVAAGLTYDNAVLGLGRWIGHGSVLEALSYPRFVLHAFTTPLLIIAGFGAARAFIGGWTCSRAVHGWFCAGATALVAWGVVDHVVLLDLVEQHEGGIASYGDAASGAPVPAIATIVVLVVLGGLVWYSAGWPWLALGSAVMFVASGLGAVSGLLTNVGELALAAALVATEQEAGRRLGSGQRPRTGAAPAVARGPVPGT